MVKRSSRGRQKVAMKKIEKEEDLVVSFSKRRAGLYKKASELCTLCDAEICVIIFSPSNKPFSFAHPNIQSIADRFLKRTPQPDPNAPAIETMRRARIDELNKRLNELSDLAKMEKERGKRLDEMLEENEHKAWWEAPVEELGREEVGTLLTWFEDLMAGLSHRLGELGTGPSASSSSAINPSNV